MALAESAFFLLLALKIFAILYKVNGRRILLTNLIDFIDFTFQMVSNEVLYSRQAEGI